MSLQRKKKILKLFYSFIAKKYTKSDKNNNRGYNI